MNRSAAMPFVGAYVWASGAAPGRRHRYPPRREFVYELPAQQHGRGYLLVAGHEVTAFSFTASLGPKSSKVLLEPSSMYISK